MHLGLKHTIGEKRDATRHPTSLALAYALPEKESNRNLYSTKSLKSKLVFTSVQTSDIFLRLSHTKYSCTGRFGDFKLGFQLE